MSRTVAITLADLIRRGSGLDAREAERLAQAWSTEIRLELEQTGISVIRGVGTLTLSSGVVRFQQDPDFPIGSELPAVEGFSEAVAASLQAASAAPPSVRKRPPVEEPAPVPDGAPEDAPAADLQAPPEAGSEAPSSADPEAPPSWEEWADVEDATSEESPAVIEPEADDEVEPVEVPLEETVPTPDAEDWSAGMEAAISNADARIDEQDVAPSVTRSPSRSSRSPRSSRTPREPRVQGPDTEGSSRWVMMVGAVVVLVVAAALLYRFVLAPGTDEPPAVASVDSSAVVSQDSLAVEADSSTVASVPQEDSGEPPVQTNQPTSTRPATEIPPATQDAGSVVAGMGGYTLIVGSTLNATAAERVRSRFTNMGLPTGVLAITADSTTRYRIAVGHFATASEADTLRIRRASELPEGTWVLSVR